MASFKLNSHHGHKFWLKITAIVVGGVGPILVLGSIAGYSEPARWCLDLLSFPVDGLQSYDSPTTRFLSAICGGVVIGWGAMIWAMSEWLYTKEPEFVRKTVLISLILWFVFDSGGSILSGNPSNAVVNVILLLLAVGPMWAKAKEVS